MNRTLPLLGLWHSMFNGDYRATIKDITVPVLYIIPEKPIYPMGAAEFIKEHASADVTIVPYPGCTHMSLVEKPDETAKTLGDFFSAK